MKIFAVYDRTSRSVIRLGQCADNCFVRQANNSNERVLEIKGPMPNLRRSSHVDDDGNLIQEP